LAAWVCTQFVSGRSAASFFSGGLALFAAQFLAWLF
jgi:hypothetical protein